MSDPTTPGTADFSLSRKGYDIDQVAQAMTRLTAERDDAWQRLAFLGDEMRGLERQLMTLQETRAVAEATVPNFEVLSPRAAGLLATAEEEAEAVRAEAVGESNRIDIGARTEARRLRAAAGQYADQLRAAADESYRRELERCRTQAEAVRAEADRECRTLREEADVYADEVRVRAEQASREAHTWLAAQQRTAEQEFTAHDAKVVAWEAEVVAIGERKLYESERHHKAMQAKSEEMAAEAVTQSERRVEAAHREAGRIAEQSAREQRTFAERREIIQSQLDHIRESLAVLTGSAAEEPPAAAGTDTPTASVQEAEADHASGTEVHGEVHTEVDTEAETSELPVLPQAVDNKAEPN